MKQISKALLLTLAMSTASMAAFATTQDVAEPGAATAEVPLTAEAATFSATVPTTLPIYVDAVGEVTVAENVAIVNNSHGKILVDDLAIAGANGWATQDYDTMEGEVTSMAVGTKKLAMVINDAKTTGEDAIDFAGGNFGSLDAKNDTDSDELAIVYDAIVPAQKEALEDAQVAQVVFTLDWDSVEAID